MCLIPSSLIKQRGQFRLFLVCVLAVLVLQPLPVEAGAPPVEEVANQLERAATLADEGDYEAAAEVLKALTVVKLDDGGEMKLAGRAWQALLDDRPPDMGQRLRQLAELLRERPDALPEGSRRRLAQVLARDEFQDRGPATGGLLELLDSLLSFLLPIGEGTGLGRILLWVAGVAALLVVLGVLGLFLRGLRQNLPEQQEKSSDAPPGVPLYAFQAQQQAADAAQTGDLREAMRLLYLAALLHLDEVGLIHFDPSQTNREVLAALSGRDQLRDLLAPVIEQVDRVWYGHAPFGQADFDRMRRQIERLRAVEPKP